MNPNLIKAATDHGIISKPRARQAWLAAEAAGIPYWVACAFLMQESGGGDNVFGHDQRNGEPIWHGRDDRVEVTEERYKAYRVYRDIGPEPRMQGVGPMQLTWWSIQDEADDNGGCWRPYNNILTAFMHISELHEQHTDWRTVAHRYNGSSTYADEMAERFEDWRGWLRVGES